MGSDETYEILNVLEFTSSRKRMSVIVRMPDNTIKLMIKGAVNILQVAFVLIFHTATFDFVDIYWSECLELFQVNLDLHSKGELLGFFTGIFTLWIASCHPSNSIKALKIANLVIQYDN